MKCINATKFHRKSGGAKWRDPLFIIGCIEFQRQCHPLLCQRSAGTYCSSSLVSNLNGSATLPFVIPTEAYPDFLPRCAGQGRACAFL
jgi:hypothetical protein